MMNDIKIKTTRGKRHKVYSFLLPTDWTEVTPIQAKKVLPLLLLNERSDRLSFELLRVLAKSVPSSLLLAIEPDQLIPLMDCLEWMYEETLSIPILPTISTGNIFFKYEYHLPKEKLENVTCFEYWVADEYYTSFLETKNEMDLNMLVSTLCREIRPNQMEARKANDVRVKLESRTEIEERAMKLKRLNPFYKSYVLYFFSGCKRWIYEQFGDFLFEEPMEGEEASEESNPMGWYGLFQKAAESNVFGTLDDILFKTNFLDFCTWMVAKRLEYDEMKRRQEKAKVNLE